jgi:arabinose-5-phosphate isomerase
MLDQQKIGLSPVQGAVRLKIKDVIANAILQESQALNDVARDIPEASILLVEKILSIKGKIIFSGIGKSGLVAQKLAATFSSLGFPSIFLHASDAMHGDLGVIQPQDLFVGISKSATGSDLETIYSFLDQNKIFSALICCGRGNLCSAAPLVVQLPFQREACLLNLAPTSSSTAIIAFGDALAVAVSSLKNFSKSDFAKNHPAGALGRRLLLTVQHFLNSSQDLPLLSANAKFSDVLYTISSKKLGVGVVVADDNRLLGMVTDGDLRRACDKYGPSVFDKNASEIMTLNPKTIDQTQLAIDALELMEAFNITSLVVTERNHIVVGVIHIHDLIKAGIKG